MYCHTDERIDSLHCRRLELRGQYRDCPYTVTWDHPYRVTRDYPYRATQNRDCPYR